MKRPFLFLFALTALAISLLYPRSYKPDPVFTQGMYYSVTVTGQLQTYSRQPNGLSLMLSDCQIFHDGQIYQCSQLLVTVDEPDIIPLQAGNQLQAEGSLSSFQPARNPGNFDWYTYYRSRHIAYRVYAEDLVITDPHVAPLRQKLLSLRETLTIRLQQICGQDTETASLLTALLVGDKTLLEEDTKANYEDGGILHILTVSGLHVSLLGTAILTLGKRLYLPPWLRSLLSSLLVLLYWQLCGCGMSAGRAAVMFVCFTAAPLLGRTYDSLSALSLAGILILWTSPTLLFQSGFQLSFGAVLGILLVCPAFVPKTHAVDPKKKSASIAKSSATQKNFFAKKPSFSFLMSLPHKFIHSLSFGLGLQLTLLPITLYHFFRYPLYSLVLNLLVLPLTTPLFLLSTCALLLAQLLPGWGTILAPWILRPCQWILHLYDLLCKLALSLPQASALLGRPLLWRITLYYILLLLFCFWHDPRRPKFKVKRRWWDKLPLAAWTAIPLTTTVLLMILLFPLPTKSLKVTFLDVGQGDCAFIETPAGTTILIDSGSSDIKNMADYRLIPFLESRGVKHLDYVFLSHTDEDHINGVADWLETGGTIGTVILPALSDDLSATPSYQQAITMLTAYHIPIHYFSQGMIWQENTLTLTCLAPVPPDKQQASLYSELNTASQVLLLQYQDIRILFTGDCEEEGESLLLSYLQAQDLTCHILKAGHHGSAYATGRNLLAQLQPQATIISCGVRNRYGHPHPTMLRRVDESGGNCYVTASCGSVTVTIHHGQAYIHTFLPEGPLYYR